MTWSGAWADAWGTAWGDGGGGPPPTPTGQTAWGDSWGTSWGDSWGGLAIVPVWTPADVTVRFFRASFFGGIYRSIGSTAIITSPYQFTPYGMTLVTTPPSDWNALMEAYSKQVDDSIVRFPGRDETRQRIQGTTQVSDEAGNPYD